MAHYSPIEQDGYRADIDIHKGVKGRWLAAVHLARRDAAQGTAPELSRKVANDFPDESHAVLAAYALAREILATMPQKV